MKQSPRTARATAQLLAMNSKLYEEERNRQVTRYRFSINTLRMISNRRAIRGTFLTELDDELAELNWLFVRLGAEFAIIALDKADSWVKLSAKRLRDDKEQFLAMDDEAIDSIYGERFADDDEDGQDYED